MDNQSVTRESVRVRYAGAEAWLDASLAYTVNARDPEMRAGLVEGGGGVKDYMRNRFVLAFRGPIVINGMPYHHDSISVMVLNGVPFALFRVAHLYFDCSGRRVEVQHG